MSEPFVVVRPRPQEALLYAVRTLIMVRRNHRKHGSTLFREEDFAEAISAAFENLDAHLSREGELPEEWDR